MNNFDYLYNPAAAKNTYDKDYFVAGKLGFQIIERGMILPFKRLSTAKTPSERLDCGGVVRDNGEYVKGSFIHHGIGAGYNPPQCNSTKF